MGSLALGAALSFVPTLSGVAQAQKSDLSQKDRREAKRLFNQAHLAYRRGDYEEAILKWEQSFELSGEPLIFLSIANAYERLGESRRALDYLKRWREKAPRREHEELDSRIERLEKRVAELDAEDAEKKRRADEKAREQKKREDDLVKDRVPPPEQVDDSVDPWTVTGWTLVGVGGAAFITGLALDGVAASKRPAEAEACAGSGDQLYCREALKNDIQSSNTFAIVGDALWISGALVAAGGAVVLLTLAGDDEAAETGPPSRSGGRVLPLVGPNGGGVVYHLSF